MLTQLCLGRLRVLNMFRFTLVRYISSLPTTSRERNRVRILDVTNGAPITVFCMIRCSILIGLLAHAHAPGLATCGVSQRRSANFGSFRSRRRSAPGCLRRLAASRDPSRLQGGNLRPSSRDASALSLLQGGNLRLSSRDASALSHALRNRGTRPFQSSSWDASARLRLRDASAPSLSLSLSHYGTEARARFRISISYRVSFSYI